MTTRSTPEADFTSPIEADFIVTLMAKNGQFCLFVEAFVKRNGKHYLKHTSRIEEAKRFSRFIAEDVVESVKEYRCTGRVERVSADNQIREVVVGKKPSQAVLA
jgi:hypothetical protein